MRCKHDQVPLVFMSFVVVAVSRAMDAPTIPHRTSERKRMSNRDVKFKVQRTGWMSCGIDDRAFGIDLHANASLFIDADRCATQVHREDKVDITSVACINVGASD